MRFADAREFVENNFTDNDEVVKQSREYSRKKFRKILFTLGTGSKFTEHKLGLAGERFLYAGCLRFDRWYSPGPYVVHHKDREYYEQFLTTLQATGTTPDNTSSLELGLLKWDIYDALDRTSPDEVSSDEIEAWKSRLTDIPRPSSPQKRGDYAGFSDDCKGLIKGAQEASLETVLTTVIPIVPLEKPTTVNCTWRNLEVSITFEPHHRIPQNTFVNPGEDSIALPIESSQWQHGITETNISIQGLLDAQAPEPSLTSPPHSSPSTNWPAMWVFSFELLEAVLWKLRVDADGPANWSFSPNDIGAITWKIMVGDQVIDSLTQDPPGVTLKIIGSKEGQDTVDMGTLSLVPWFVRCKELAKDYATAGETSEAVFWLNVGAEALFDIRCRDICSNAAVDYELLSSGRSYWEKAREFVAEQMPDEAERIEWPEAASGTPSWFTQIRELGEHVELAASTEKFLSEYSKIHKHRNDVFHGDRRDRVSPSEVAEGAEALSWLIKNFKRAERVEADK